MKVIGVTGGVGAGKSMVLEILKETYKARILSADEIGRELMEPGSACFEPVVDLFGTDVIGMDGRLDRGKIAGIVFRNEEALGQLNALIHPAVRREIEARLYRWKEEEALGGNIQKRLVVMESAILLEAGYEEICEEVWYVYASKELRMKRLEESRGYSKERCLKVMENQMEETELRKRATVVIENDGSREWTKEQIKRLLVHRKAGDK
ncbi:MAG: dephospho-CoA kinase [Lachnospiraceae bacterium]|nr:dephospho-CoA kinase [Lachnospiraceae bacterium]